MPTVAVRLDKMTREGELYTRFPDQSVRCFACGHRCLIRKNRRGICKVRFNREGTLYVPWGYVAGLQSDPIEKKPFFHILPGEDALTFGMLGCDFHCTYCQNWLSSQTLRDRSSDASARYIQEISPEAIMALCEKSRSRIIASSYNEPLITTEWAVEIFKLAKKEGIPCVYVSNGNMTPEVLDYLSPFLMGYKIDLKTMQARQYRKLGGVLENVLDGIRMAKEKGLWVEVVTLVVPGFNDSTDELMDTARFIASVSREIPWHVTAFHPDYKMVNSFRTTDSSLIRAAEIGQEAGLDFVYAGNLPGIVGDYESTYCPGCQTRLIQRVGYRLIDYQLSGDGSCVHCGTKIQGIWTPKPDQVRLGRAGMPRFPF